MSAIEVDVRVIVDLLFRGQFMTVEKVTRGRRLTEREIESAVSAYGRTLVAPGKNWWSTVEVTPINAGERAAFHVVAPFWTREEGRSDLSLELRLTESPAHVYEVELIDIRVL